MNSLYVTVLGGVFLLSTITLLVVNKSQRGIVLERLRLGRLRSPDSSTPPRSLSPEKTLTESSPYKDVFPPSRRFALAEIEPDFARRLGKPIEELVKSPANSRTALQPMTVASSEADQGLYTPTEFSLAEIEALGDFPDYATLSGIPLPKPYPELDVTKAKPRPYRPLRWAYHQTMCKQPLRLSDTVQLLTGELQALTRLEPDWWLELESTYAERIKQRQGLFEKHGKRVLDASPGSEIACKELMEMTVQFMCARYPQYFAFDRESMTFTNRILGTTTDLRQTGPLNFLMDNVPEDFAVMQRDPETGFYFFRAGVICSSLGWDLASKFGLQLHEIHAPIPDYKEKMQFSMDR